MNRRDMMHRLAGIAILLGAGASTVLHREIWLEASAGPATGTEVALGLLSFMLASLGILLVISGARLRDGWKRDCEEVAHRRAGRARPSHSASDNTESPPIMVPTADYVAFTDGRAALATFLVLRARQAAATRASATVSEKLKRGVSQ